MPAPYVETPRSKKKKNLWGGFEEMKEVCDGIHDTARE